MITVTDEIVANVSCAKCCRETTEFGPSVDEIRSRLEREGWRFEPDWCPSCIAEETIPARELVRDAAHSAGYWGRRDAF